MKILEKILKEIEKATFQEDAPIYTDVEVIPAELILHEKGWKE